MSLGKMWKRSVMKRSNLTNSQISFKSSNAPLIKFIPNYSSQNNNKTKICFDLTAVTFHINTDRFTVKHVMLSTVCFASLGQNEEIISANHSLNTFDGKHVKKTETTSSQGESTTSEQYLSMMALNEYYFTQNTVMQTEIHRKPSRFPEKMTQMFVKRLTFGFITSSQNSGTDLCFVLKYICKHFDLYHNKCTKMFADYQHKPCASFTYISLIYGLW